MDRINKWAVYPVSATKAIFDLFAYNAHDMNLNFLYLSYNDSSNISKINPPNTPIAIKYFLHKGDSCGYPGGCNNMSPLIPEINDIEIEGIPAMEKFGCGNRNQNLSSSHLTWYL